MSNDIGQLQSVPQCTVPTYILDIPRCSRQLPYSQTPQLLCVNFKQLHNQTQYMCVCVYIYIYVCVCVCVYIYILLSAIQQKYSHLSLHTFTEFQTLLLRLLYFGSCAIVTPTSPVAESIVLLLTAVANQNL